PKKKNCRSVEDLRVVLFANVFSTSRDVSYNTPVSDRYSINKVNGTYGNLSLHEKGTHARLAIVAHLTSASQRWFGAVRYERIRLQTHDQTLSTGNTFDGLSSGPPHGEHIK
ncbi:MAG TPA: hypothetical protein VFV44_07415, partial [Nitrospiraceae bacterium]|nr:hypothetical protein [Nitrospiraceae bacterium]